MDGLLAITVLLVLGVAAQWIAWRLHLPSILLLLAMGFAVGPGRLDLFDPVSLLGDMLFPVVSAAVGVILFEGGLSLRLRDLGSHAPVVWRLVTVGALVTFVLGALSAHLLMGLDLGVAALIGGVLIVSGPTVVQPLLRHVKPMGPVGPILRWEGIVIDPVGATVALLVFEAITDHSGNSSAVLGILETLAAGGAVGLAGAGLLYIALKRYWIPDPLHVPFTLAVVLASFTGAHWLQHESGLLAVTLMGILLANQKSVSVRHILEFKEHLSVLLVSSLFILLASRITVGDLATLDMGAFAFLGVLILVVRPLAVWVCTMGSELGKKERIFLAWLCPRGIVAAAVASVFSIQLVKGEMPGADRIVPVTFLVIIGTVVVYGLTAAPLARRLGLSVARPQGLLIVGASAWVRKLAAVLKDLNVTTLLVDTNRENLRAARMQGLRTWHGDILGEFALDEVDLAGIGRVVAVTPNDEVNELVALELQHEFGREQAYRLARTNKVPSGESHEGDAGIRGRVLLGGRSTYRDLSRRFSAGETFRATHLTEQFDWEAYLDRYGEDARPLLLVDAAGDVLLDTVDRPLKPSPGHTLVALVRAPESEDDAPAAD